MNRRERLRKDDPRSLLEICLDVHMTHEGSMERFGLDQIKDLELLNEWLDTWEPSTPKSELFDEAVRQLILATIAEAKRG